MCPLVLLLIHSSTNPLYISHYPSITYVFLRPKGDVEVDAQIEASLAGEASLIVLDTIELLVSNVGSTEILKVFLERV